MAKKRGLGRGLDALLSDSGVAEALVPAAVAEAEVLRTLPTTALRPNPDQPRKDFAEDSLTELAQSIEKQGVIQPIVVQASAAGGGRYTIIAGERRWRAAQRAGLEEVPVVVREDLDTSEVLQLALVENLQRADLNAIEEAEAYRELREVHGFSQEQIAQQVGKSRASVTNQLRLLRLPEGIQDLLRKGQLTAGQARPLLRLGRAEAQEALASRAIREQLSARQLEEVARQQHPVGDRKATSVPESDIHTRRAAERLTRALQTKVEIRRKRAGGGQVRIHFHSEEELMRLYELLA